MAALYVLGRRSLNAMGCAEGRSPFVSVQTLAGHGWPAQAALARGEAMEGEGQALLYAASTDFDFYLIHRSEALTTGLFKGR